MTAIILAAIFGLLIGSFLNVCIYRWPRDLSVVRPRSACPACEKPIAWYDNIPLVSYAVLRARCRHCGTAIPWRYPVVEFLTAISFGWVAAHAGLTPITAKYCIFAAIMIGLLFSDLETLLLPDELTIGGFVIGLVFAVFIPVPDGTFRFFASLFGYHFAPRAAMIGEALFGALVPAGSLWFGGWLFEKVRHKEGLGFGDVKMLAMVGVFLGIRGALLTIILGSLAGSIIGLAFIKLTGKDAGTYPLPFGSFLAAAGMFAAIQMQSVAGWGLQSLH